MSSPPPPPPPDLPPPSPGSAYLGPPTTVKHSKPVGLPIVALVLALIGCCAGIVPMFMSLRALGNVRRGTGGGKLIAQIALLLSVVWLLFTLFGTVIGVKLLTFRDGTGVVSKEGYLFAYDVRTGDCMKKPPSSPIFVKAIPCGLPHETEVFAMFNTSSKITKEAAAAECAPAFKEYVGRAVDKSELELTTVKIADSRFSTTGRIACLVGMKGGADTAGTLKGTKR